MIRCLEFKTDVFLMIVYFPIKLTYGCQSLRQLEFYSVKKAALPKPKQDLDCSQLKNEVLFPTYHNRPGFQPRTKLAF